MRLLLATLLLALPLAAQEANRDLHDELRAFKTKLAAAVNAGNVDGIAAMLHPNVVVTFQDAHVARGRDAFKTYYTKMMSGPGKIVKSFSAEPTVDELTILYGGNTVGISFGSSVDKFELTTGQSFEMTSRWTATLVKEDGRFLVASFHASCDLFDNPLLRTAKRAAYWGGGIAFFAGLFFGYFLRSRRR